MIDDMGSYIGPICSRCDGRGVVTVVRTEIGVGLFLEAGKAYAFTVREVCPHCNGTRFEPTPEALHYFRFPR